jgi:hypothetical protein
MGVKKDSFALDFHDFSGTLEIKNFLKTKKQGLKFCKKRQKF